MKRRGWYLMHIPALSPARWRALAVHTLALGRQREEEAHSGARASVPPLAPARLTRTRVRPQRH